MKVEGWRFEGPGLKVEGGGLRVDDGWMRVEVEGKGRGRRAKEER